MHPAIEQLAARIADLFGKGSVSGASEQDVQELQSLWRAPGLPSAYVDFLNVMGYQAGGLLEGTDAFLPCIKRMPKFVADFLSDNEGSWRPPEGSLVFAMHQGYQIYFMENAALDNPPVALYMEGDAEPMRHWDSLTSFLGSQFVEDCGRPSG